MAANLPEGYYARPIDMEDTRKIAELFDAQARWLTSAIVEEDFNFYGRTLTGQKELQARWKRYQYMAAATL